MASLPDLWDGCYDQDHRKQMSPDEFRSTFCHNCANARCRNSQGSGMTDWLKRMMTQEDRLLNNPDFADPRDPQYASIRDLDFKSMIRRSLAIEVSTRKGDWSVPTSEEIGRAAAEMTGMIPTSFQAPLVDEIRLTDLEGRSAPTSREPEEDSTPSPPALAAPATTAPSRGPQEPREPRSWKIRGASGNVYETTLHPDGSWECSCPSLESPCKHARKIEDRQRREPVLETETVPTRAKPLPHVPSMHNTRAPAAGIMVGGGEPPPPIAPSDPWEAPPTKPKERVIPVGGRVRFSSGKKKK